MSYQVKSTPFFRRMVSVSKKNGQLQRLKEEYERIKEFNDRTIEMKMHQVRLKRLLREIEEIKESSSQWKRRRIATERAKTNEDKRAQTLVKAKELGKQYTQYNKRNMSPLVGDQEEDSSEEYTLRESSKATDLTLRQVKNKTSPSNSENDLLPGEVLLSVVTESGGDAIFAGSQNSQYHCREKAKRRQGWHSNRPAAQGARRGAERGFRVWH